jgi:hypothetical protein
MQFDKENMRISHMKIRHKATGYKKELFVYCTVGLISDKLYCGNLFNSKQVYFIFTKENKTIKRFKCTNIRKQVLSETKFAYIVMAQF